MDLFTPQVPENRYHFVFKLLLGNSYAAERAVLNDWAVKFPDRDRKFVKEFQTTFESSVWELYLRACFQELGAAIDFDTASPDFTLSLGQDLCIEATIAAPSIGGKNAYGPGSFEQIKDLNRFNADSMVRITNSFSAKSSKYTNSYQLLDHVANKPYAIAIASFDRPVAHLATTRPIIAALYGVYFDEEATLAKNRSTLVAYNVTGVMKNEITEIPVGLFNDDKHSYVSAVFYNTLSVWGKIRALADNPEQASYYLTMHPNKDSITPLVRKTLKRDYTEHLLDGLCLFHNPHATNPIQIETFEHDRFAQIKIEDDGEINTMAPEDQILFRTLFSFITESNKND